ncbi:MAG: rod-binding protein [Lentisphaerota bacterium]
MNIPATSSASPVHETKAEATLRREDERLQQACKDFEGFFIGIIMKEGMLSSMENTEGENSQSSAGMQELAIEQVAQQLGDTGSMGLADVLYRQFALQKGDATHE